MPNRHETLVIKLISIGISHDLSFLEKIKYTKENGKSKWSESDFVAVYRKLFMALLTLGFIIKDYKLRRLCIQAASVCEPVTKFCEEILTYFPDGEMPTANDSPEMKEVYWQLREQIETFQSAIKMNISLPSTWSKASVMCYENLDFYNRRIRLSEELKPLAYPGVEKYLKRPRVYSTDEVPVVEKKELKAEEILLESKKFATDISSRFRRLKIPTTSQNIPTSSEITVKIIKTLQTSNSFEFENGKIFMKLSDSLSLESSKNYHIHWYWIEKERLKVNAAYLFFDFNMKPRDATPCIDVASIYRKGIVRVYDLCQRSFTIFDTENVMLYTIMDKKRYFIKQEFIDLNHNKLVQDTNDQSQHAFNYLLCQKLPEYSRVSRIQAIGLTSSNVYEYCLERYTFDATPCRYKYLKKIQDTDHEENLDISSEPTKVNLEKIPKAPRTTSSKDVVRKPGPACNTMTKKAERAQAGFIPSTETFHASEEMMGIFALLENELSKAAGCKVSINLKQLMDESSPHKISVTYNASTLMTVKVSKKRNNHICTERSIEFSLPARVHSWFIIGSEWTDSIVYDKNFDNPRLESVETSKNLSGNITFDHVTVNVKSIDLECNFGGSLNMIKLGMRMGSRSRAKNESSREGNKSISEASGILSPKRPFKLPMNNDLVLNLPTNNELVQTPVIIKLEPNSQEYDPPLGDSSQDYQMNQTPEQVVNPVISETQNNLIEASDHGDNSVNYSQLTNYDQHNGSIEMMNAVQSPPVINYNVDPSIIHQSETFNGTFDDPMMEASEIKLEVRSDTMDFIPSSKEVQQTEINETAEIIQFEPAQVKAEHVCEENQFGMMPALQNLPEISIGIIPKAEKLEVHKVEDVTPSKLHENQSNGRLNGFDDSSSTDTASSADNQVVPVKSFNGYGIERSHVSTKCNSEAPVGGTVDDFEEMLTDVHVVKKPILPKDPPVCKPKAKAQMPPKNPPSSHLPEVYNRRQLDPRINSVEIKQDTLDLSPEDVIDLTVTDEAEYVIKHVRPCPRSKKLAITKLDILNSSFENIFPTCGDRSDKLKENYSRVLKKVEAKNKVFPKRVHDEVYENVSAKIQAEPKRCKVHLYNVMQHIDRNQPRRNIKVNVEAVNLKFKASVSFKFCR